MSLVNRSIHRSTAIGLAAALLVWGGMAMPMLIVWLAFVQLGGWPLNDDPFYAKPIAFWSAGDGLHWVRQGGALTASSVAHVFTGLLGAIGHKFSYRPLFLICIAQQSLGSAAIFFLARSLKLSYGFAVLASLTLALFPLYFGHAFTYMTDGPATAWSSIACAFLVFGIIKNDWRWLCVGSLAIGWGYWIRQTNGLLVLSPLIALSLHRWHKGYSSAPGLKQFAAVMAGSGLAFLLLETGGVLSSSFGRISDIAPSRESGYAKQVVISAYGLLLLVGWYAIPWLPLLIREAIRAEKHLTSGLRRICLGTTIFVLLVGFSPLVLTQGRACITNSTGAFIQNGHYGPIFLSDMDEPSRWGELDGVAWPLWVWTSLSIVALLSSSMVSWWVAWTGVHCWSRSKFAADSRLAAAFGLMVMTGMSAIAILLFVEPHMDRYWLFLFPGIVIWWLLIAAKCEWKMPRFAVAWAALWMFFNGGISVVFTHDMLTWNDVRWQFVNTQLAAGVPAERMDAGRDVNAWLRLDEDVDSMPRLGDTSKWWSGEASIALAVGYRPGWHETDRLPWSAWATGRIHHLLVLERDDSNNSFSHSRSKKESSP